MLADSERADIERERRELEANPEHEQRELAAIYIRRGLSKQLALQVAEALSNKDVLEAHARDELGITEDSVANPIQAAVASAASFISGGLAPLITALGWHKDDLPDPNMILCHKQIFTSIVIIQYLLLGSSWEQEAPFFGSVDSRCVQQTLDVISAVHLCIRCMTHMLASYLSTKV